MKAYDHPFNAIATCTLCNHTDSVTVTCGEIKRFVHGTELVQNIWPDLSTDEREVLIGWRNQRRDGMVYEGFTQAEAGGFHLCSTCWDSNLGED